MPSATPRWFRERVDPVPDTTVLPVTTVELFFDLVFVFTVTQLTHVLLHDFAAGAAQSVLMFAVIWYMYAAYAWVTNAVPPVRPARRILLLAGMAGWLVIALSVPDAFHGTGGWFAVGLLTVVVIHGLMYLQSTRRILPFLTCNLVGTGLVFAASFVHGPWQYLLWAGALVVMWLAPAITGQEGFPLHPGHIAERHGLIVIITLGESIIAVGRSVSEGELDGSGVGMALLGLVLAAGLWWSYFTTEAERAERALVATTDQVRRTRMVLVGYFFCHVPILLGVVAMAAGMSVAVEAAGEPLTGGARFALSGGLAVFLIGSVAFSAVLGHRSGPLRWVVAALALAIIPLSAISALAQLSALVVSLTAMLLLEALSSRRSRLDRSAAISLPPGNPFVVRFCLSRPRS